MPEPLGSGGECRVCGEGEVKACSRCKAIAYCSQGHQAKDWARHRHHCHPVAVAELEGRGRGLVATRQVSRGELVVAEAPLLVVREGGDLPTMGESLARQVSALPSHLAAQLHLLTAKPGVEEVAARLQAAAGQDPARRATADRVAANSRVTAIFLNNDIACDADTKGLYLNLALTNHSCAPNCAWTCGVGVGQERRMELRAIAPILPGQEVTVSYIMVEGRFLDSKARRTRLKDGWDFTCDCTLCTSGSEEGIRAEIVSIQEDMRALCDTSPDCVDWCALYSLQRRLVHLVDSLASAPVIILRELQSLANLGHLARSVEGVEEAVEMWRSRVGEVAIPRALRELEEMEARLEEWRSHREGGLTPLPEEMTNFLWLI